MKKLNVILFTSLLLFASISTFCQKRIIVNKGNFTAAGWEERQIDIDPPTSNPIPKADSDFITFRCDAPPMPANNGERMRPGSMYMSFPKGSADTDLPGTSKAPNLSRVLLSNNKFHNVKLSEITELMYSTWTVATNRNSPDASGVTPHPPVAPTLLLQIDMFGDGSFIDNINYHPAKQGPHIRPNGSVFQEKVETGRWHEWDALNGWWVYFRRHPQDPEGIPGVFLLKDFIKLFPEAKIVNTDPTKPMQGPGLRFLLGTDPDSNTIDFKGYVDGIKIHTPLISSNKIGGINTSGYIMYDFESVCLFNVEIPWWIFPPWPIYRNPILILCFIIAGMVVIFKLRNPKNKADNTFAKA